MAGKRLKPKVSQLDQVKLEMTGPSSSEEIDGLKEAEAEIKRRAAEMEEKAAIKARLEKKRTYGKM